MRIQSSTTFRTSFRPLYPPIQLTVLPWTRIKHCVKSSRALRVEPLGPSNRCRRLTNRSLFLTNPPILIMSQTTASSRIFTACSKGTLRERSLIKSLALRMAAGSKVFRVVLTVMLPSTRSRTQLIPYKVSGMIGKKLYTCFSRAFVARGQILRRYCSRYFGKRVAKEDSSVKGFTLSSFVKGSTFH